MENKKNEIPRGTSNVQLNVLDWQDLVKQFLPAHELNNNDDPIWMSDTPLTIKRRKFRFQSDD